MYMGFSSSCIKKTNKSYFKEYYDYILEKDKDGLTNKKERDIIARTRVLDSSLITATLENGKKKYDVKIIHCNNYIYVYNYKENRIIKNKNIEIVDKKEKEIKKKLKNIKLIDTDNLKNIDCDFDNINNNKIKLKTIEEKNLNRSKYNLQRLIKTNEDIFKTFITLTFNDDIRDIKIANKKFHIFITKVKSIYKDFKYICVPEFQKNDRVHYHLLTNIDYNNIQLINENFILLNFIKKYNNFKLEHISYKYNFKKEIKFNEMNICLRYIDNILHNTKKTYNLKSKKNKIFKTIRYWSYGYSSVLYLKNINVVGYMTKYFTKDIDNRLFGFRRYFYSQNLKQPKIEYLSTSDLIENLNMECLFNKYDIVFKKEYVSINDRSIVEFRELKKIN